MGIGLNLIFDLTNLARGQEMVDQQRNVVPAFTQRRERQGNDVEPIEKIFAEASILLLLLSPLFVAAMIRTSACCSCVPPTRR